MKILRFIIFFAVIVLMFYLGNKYLYEPRQHINVYEDKDNPLTTFTTNENVKIDTFKDNTFFLTNKNSTKLIDTKGDVLWESPITLTSPKTKCSKNYLVTGDKKGGKTLNVFNSNGFLFNIVLSNEIIDFSINDDGYVSLIANDTNGYIIKLFDNTGKEILKKTMYDKNIYPITTKCSGDSQLMAYSVIDTNYMKVKSDVSFLFTSGNDTNQYVGNAGEFAGKNYDNEIVYDIQFVKNKIVLFTDSNIYIYNYTNNTLELVSTIKLNNELIDYDFINNKYLVLSLGNGLNSQSKYNTGSILIYDLNGELIYEKYGNNIEAHIDATKSGVLVNENRNVYYLLPNGNIPWEYMCSSDINDVVYIGNNLECVLITNSAVISLKEEK